MAYYNPVTTIASVGTVSTPIPVTISSTTEPTARPNGGTLMQGDNWWDPDTETEYVWILDNQGVGAWYKVSSAGGGGSFNGGHVEESITIGGSEDSHIILNISSLDRLGDDRVMRVNIKFKLLVNDLFGNNKILSHKLALD